MTLTQINYFLTVANEGSISSAANRLFVSQPAVSKQIASLEAELGFQLFDRVDRRLHLTEAGILMRDNLRRCTDDFQNTVDKIRHNSTVRKGSLHIGCVDAWNASLFMTELNRYFSDTHSDVELIVEAYSAPEIMDALTNKEIDIALCYYYAFSNQSGIFATPIRTLECGLLYSKAHFQTITQPKDFDGVSILINASDSNPFFRITNYLLSTYDLCCEKKLCRRSSTATMRAFCGDGVLPVSEWNHLISSSEFGYMPLGRELPISAVHLQSSLDSDKRFLINEAIWLLKNTFA